MVYLVAPLEVLLARTAARTNNSYGRSPEDRAEIARYVAEVEPLAEVPVSSSTLAGRPQSRPER